MQKKKRKLPPLRELAPVRLTVLGLCLAVELCYRLLRSRPSALAWVSEHIARPWHAFAGRLCSHLPFSAAELIYALAGVFIIVYIIYSVVQLIRKPRKWHTVYIIVLTLLMTAAVYLGGFRVLWSVCYYEPDVSDKSGVSDAGVTEEQLAAVTRYFADEANEYAPQTERDGNGVFTASRREITEKAPAVYRGVTELFPFLEGQELKPKLIICSPIMSLMEFTGFFFPFTGEANLNAGFPPSLLPSTAMHELSHQRGVASEQECNFLAVVACMESDDPDFAYSGALLAYIYLGNALYGADNDAWAEISSGLCAEVRADFAANSAYWAQFEDNVVQRTSERVYDSFLKSNGIEDGVKNYGACVDMLVNYYLEAAGGE